MLRKLFNTAVAHDPILEAARRLLLTSSVVVLMYHEVLDDDVDVNAWTIVRQRDFERQMAYLRRSLSIVDLDEALDAIAGRRRVSPMVVVTFDDGYAGNLTTALPVVEALDIPITVFVATAAVENQTVHWFDHVILRLQNRLPMSLPLRDLGLSTYEFPGTTAEERHWDELQRLLSDLKRLDPESRDRAVDALKVRLPAGAAPVRPLSIGELRALARSPHVTIGAHTHCHSRLSQLDAQGIRRTIGQSKRLLEEWTSRPVRHFAYPYGDVPGQAVDEVKAAGFASAVTTEKRAWTRRDSVYRIPRVGVGRFDDLNRFRTAVSGLLM